MKNLKSQILNLKSSGFRNGIVSLGAVLILGSVVVGIALSVALISYILNSTNLAIKLSAEALAAAQAGVNEGIMRILRNDYPSSPTFSPFLPGGASATVRICKDLTGGTSVSGCGATPASGRYEIISEGASLLKKRLGVAVLDVNPISRSLTVSSFAEKP